MAAIIAFAQGNLAAVFTAVAVVLASFILLKYRRRADLPRRRRHADVSDQNASSFISLSADAVAKGIQRRSEKFLRQVFNRYSGANGQEDAKAKEKLRLTVHQVSAALIEVDAPVIPEDNDAARLAHLRGHSSSGEDTLTFTDFCRAATAPDELQLYLDDQGLPMVADALRPHIGRGNDQLQLMGTLHVSMLDAANAAVMSAIPGRVQAVQTLLRRSFEEILLVQDEAQKDATGKFKLLPMSVGKIQHFHAGLTGRVGNPHPNVDTDMKNEHCFKAGCDTIFTTCNYKITTTPKQEWSYVVGDEAGQLTPCPDSDMNFQRQIPRVRDLLKHDIVQKHKADLSMAEMIAIVLYSGPMFQIYNTVLRQYPQDKYEELVNGGNTFSTTIFVLVSAVQKLSRHTRIPAGTLLYRGLGGKFDLPPDFSVADVNGCHG
jgi:hypothetical protein